MYRLYYINITLPKVSKANSSHLKNFWLEDEFPFGKASCQGLC